MSMEVGCVIAQHMKENACYNCCNSCNYATHVCGGCGENLTHDGREATTGVFHFGCVDEYTQRDGKVTTVRGI